MSSPQNLQSRLPSLHFKSQLSKRRRLLNHNLKNLKMRLQRSQLPRRPQWLNPPLPNLHFKSPLLQRRKCKRANNHQANNKSSQLPRLKLKSPSKLLSHPNNNKSQPRLLQSEKLQRILQSRKYNSKSKTLKMMRLENSKSVSKDFHSTLLMLMSEPCSSHAEKSLISTFS